MERRKEDRETQSVQWGFNGENPAILNYMQLHKLYLSIEEHSEIV